MSERIRAGRRRSASALVGVALLGLAAGARAGERAALEAAMDAAVPAALEVGRVPGAVILVGRRTDAGFERWVKAYGRLQTTPDERAMPVDAIFDMASLTKPVATGLSLLALVEDGKVRLDAPVGEYLPEFRDEAKRGVTVRHLMTHTSGLPSYLTVADRDALKAASGFPCPRATRDWIRKLELARPPGETFVYSCLNAILCAEIVETVAGRPLDEFARERIFEPLGMHETRFIRMDANARPIDLSPADAARCLVSTRTDYGAGQDGLLCGQVHDPLAAMQAGVSGNAGLFSTAADLSRLAEALLNDGELDGRRILRAATVAEMSSQQDLGVEGLAATRGLLWQLYPRDDDTPHAGYGHTGYTGVALRMYPEAGLYVLALTNRVHPDDSAKVEGLRAAVWRAALNWHAPPQPEPARPAADTAGGEVRTGLDVLVRDGFAPLAGRRVGLITNHTGIDREWRTTLELIHAAPDVKLVTIFSPEHGLKGVLDEKVADTKDPLTGLHVYSLYGETRKPTAEMVAGIDTLVFDIQDIGTRFYTYIATMGLAMEAAAEHGLRFFVLDRPNPITGTRVFGPMNTRDGAFTAYHTIPLVHGMTVGELAQMFRAERNLDVDLHVIGMEGWRRAMWFDETGLPWVNPSPNMRSLTQAALYPAIGMIEACAVSVGRGTDTPFERLGAPWVAPRPLAERLNAAGLAGVRFVPFRFTPTSSKHAGRECGGVQVLLTDRDAFDPLRTGAHVVHALEALCGADFDAERVQRLIFNEEWVAEVTADPGRADARAGAVEAFRQRRTPFLMYD